MILERRIPLSYWFHIIKWDMLYVTLFAVVISFSSTYLNQLNIPISIGAFLGTAIALLLSFKLSHSYDRWWEARKIWGAIVNDSRTLVVQIKAFVGNEANATVARMAFRQIAWCYALTQNLRNKPVLDEIQGFIDEEELMKVASHINIPLALLDFHNQDLALLHQEKAVNDYQQMQVDRTLVNICASMGKAERIKNTAFPKTYRKALHLFIYIFLITLSSALPDMPRIFEIPFMIFISLPFFLVEKIAFTIQDPFENRPTDTPMTSISRTIEINIKQLLEETDLPQTTASTKYFEL